MAWPKVISGEQAGPGTHQWAQRLFPLALFLLALAPRLVALNRYITPDELLWVYRSVLLREAVADGRWADTLVAGHPGVTTTWLGAAGISAQLITNPSLQTDYDWLTKMANLLPDNATAFTKLGGFLSSGRSAVAIVNSLAVLLIFLLVKRLWGFGVAALAGILLALDPFAAGLSGLLHVDALSASFATLALLTMGVAAVAWGEDDHPWYFAGWLALSGLATGLAIMTKTPTLVLGIVAALVFVIWYLSLRGPLFSPDRRRLLISFTFGVSSLL
ncbi:MAG: glycosyltransferase family 39 protein [Chloroflexota bacterium]